MTAISGWTRTRKAHFVVHFAGDSVGVPCSPPRASKPTTRTFPFPRPRSRRCAGAAGAHTIALIQLPTGFGKTGVATLAPFYCNASRRVLVITPSLQVGCVVPR